LRRRILAGDSFIAGIMAALRRARPF